MGYLDNSSVVVHPQLGHNGFPMDGSLMGAGWVVKSKIWRKNPCWAVIQFGWLELRTVGLSST